MHLPQSCSASRMCDGSPSASPLVPARLALGLLVLLVPLLHALQREHGRHQALLFNQHLVILAQHTLRGNLLIMNHSAAMVPKLAVNATFSRPISSTQAVNTAPCNIRLGISGGLGRG